MDNMRDQLKIVGWLNIASGVLGIAVALFIAMVMTGIGAASGEAGVFALLAGIGGAIAVFTGILALPSILGGWGILNYKPWSRILVLILGFLNLLAFPIGTLIGGYSIYVLLNDESKRLLESGGSAGYGELPPSY